MRFLFLLLLCSFTLLAQAQTAEDHYKSGSNHFNNGDYQKAIIDFSKAIELDVDMSNAYLYRGMAKYLLEDDKAALEDLNTAIKLDPKSGEAYYQRGLIFFYLKKNNSACLDWAAAYELDKPQALNLIDRYCD